MIKPQDWADWVRSPITQAVIQTLEEKKNSLIGELLNATAFTVEEIGLKHLTLRNQLDGLGEFLDLESLAESCGVIANED